MRLKNIVSLYTLLIFNFIASLQTFFRGIPGIYLIGLDMGSNTRQR